MRRATSSLICTLTLTWVPLPIAAQNTVIVEIPIVMEGHRTMVPATVGSSGSLRLLLDTGMPYDGIVLFDTAKVDLAAFEQLAQVQIRGAGEGGVSHGLSDAAATFSVGPQKFENQRVTILTEEGWSQSSFDGVIGYSLLGHYAVEIDYDRNRAILYEPSTFTPDEGWESIDITFKDNRIPWMEIAVATGHEEPVRLSAYIDFASREAVELLERDTNVFTPPVLTGDSTIGRGLSGEVPGRRGRVSTVQIGPWVLRDVLVNLVPADIRSRQAGADAIVANDALRRFNVIFDYAHSQIHLRPNRHFSEPFQ